MLFQFKFAAICLTVCLFFFTHNTVAANKPVNQDKGCSRGNAGDQYECFLKVLATKEKEMDALISQSIKNYKSIWGEKAEAEFKRRVTRGQEAWKKYSYNHCYAGYYSMAPVHPMSHDAHSTACKLSKTQDRISEIRREYLNQRSENER